MLGKLLGGQRTSRTTHDEDRAAALSPGDLLGLGLPNQETLDNALYDGLEPIVSSMKAGHLTEEEGTMMIKLLVAAYAGATVNRRVADLLRN